MINATAWEIFLGRTVYPALCGVAILAAIGLVWFVFVTVSNRKEKKGKKK